MNKKVVALVLACVLIFSTIVAGTLAWLQVKTGPVTNTFTFGNVNITLTESVDAGNDGTQNFELIPGEKIAKDPVVTVKKGSEASWIFVEVTESDNLDTYVSYAAAAGWQTITDANGKTVYAYNTTVAASAADQELYFLAGEGEADLKNGMVTCNNVTKSQIDALSEDDATQPSLAFTAYAVQAEAGVTAQLAWNATYGATVTP